MMRCFCLPPKLTLMQQNNQAPKTGLFLSLFADAKKKIQKDFIEKDYFFLTFGIFNIIFNNMGVVLSKCNFFAT